jgi:hypothetical protein
VTAPDLSAGQQTSMQPEPATRTRLTPIQKKLVGLVAAAATTIAVIGFAGSYRAVTTLALAKGFGAFAYAFPAGVDAGIVAFLGLDLVLTWLRMPYPLLRQGAWGLTGATIAFNAAAAWGDWLAVGMHATIPILFVIVVEAARHAIGRIADIVADRHIESPPIVRWLLSPVGTFLIWRRMRVWQIPSYLVVITLLRELRVYRAKLRKKYGWQWRWLADADELLPFDMARFGISVSEALAMPEVEAEAQRKAEAARAAEARRQAELEAEALRVEEQQRQAEAETRRLTEAETEAKLAEVAWNRKLADAEAEARLAEIERQRLIAEAEAEVERARIAEQQRQAEADAGLKRRQEAEAAAKRTAEAEAEALRLTQDRLRLQDEALRKQLKRERPAENPKSKLRPEPEAASTRNPKPEAEATPKRPAEIGSRRARIEAEVETLLRLIETEGYDAINLQRAIEALNLKQTTAYDRLVKAQARWNDQNAA